MEHDNDSQTSALKSCKRCGGTEFGHGKIVGEGSVYPLKARFAIGGSELVLEFCLDCGEVDSLRVKAPHSFRN
ncbi:hypothetical protein PM3016_3972 [Paenibacillus mucilaginosus 3016]|uniref:Uncharacterized protein n=2 Tax=Paenibacillus mucilaginosus TaxID=61624 RepID=H6NHZ2_9BACL|nr:hypothetical protein PM3016_3972 [Paenibacillus mucilaginosus 3016]AFH63086.1 hypothetical protein B2K_20665 [Paenibacillus mucilaginosus K02]WFA19371.1 hypothetical protein ERY13_20035 [Paenibacillus mucilaginosus]